MKVTRKKKKKGKPGALPGLTRRRGLDLDLLPAIPSSDAAAAAAVCRRLLSPLHLTLVSEQKLDVLLLERVGGAAGRAHAEVGGQLAPLLVLVHLSGGNGKTGIWHNESTVSRILFPPPSLLSGVFQQFVAVHLSFSLKYGCVQPTHS